MNYEGGLDVKQSAVLLSLAAAASRCCPSPLTSPLNLISDENMCQVTFRESHEWKHIRLQVASRRKAACKYDRAASGLCGEGWS